MYHGNHIQQQTNPADRIQQKLKMSMAEGVWVLETLCYGLLVPAMGCYWFHHHMGASNSL